MFSLLHISVLTTLFSSTALAVVSAEIINGCPFTVFYQLADAVNKPGDVMTIQAGDGFYTENFDVNGARSIGVAENSNAFFGQGPAATVEYTVRRGTIFYDLSTASSGGSSPPFAGYKTILETTDSSCPTVSIVYPDQNVNGEGIVKTCQSGVNLLYILCT